MRRDEYLRWICGFANADGGVLVIGRDGKGFAVGAPNAKKLLGVLISYLVLRKGMSIYIILYFILEL